MAGKQPPQEGGPVPELVQVRRHQTMDEYYLSCLTTAREFIKQYAGLKHRFTRPVDDWSDANPPVQIRQQINRLSVPVKIALRNIGMTYTMPVTHHNRTVEVDLATDIFVLESYETFTGWDYVFDKLERAIGVYEHRLQSGLAIHDSASELDSYGLRLSSTLQKAIRPIFREPPRDELQIQDVMRGIFLAAGLEYSTVYSIPFAHGTVRPDFYFPDVQIAVEVKYARGGNLQRLVAEMSDDVTRYGNDSVRRIIFFVYDHGQIANMDEFVGAFEKSEHVRVVIVKH